MIGVMTSAAAGRKLEGMDRPARRHPGPWIIQETSRAYRIVDGSGTLLGEIAFGTRPGVEVPKEEARRMAERMVAAGEVLAEQASDATEPASRLDDTLPI